MDEIFESDPRLDALHAAFVALFAEYPTTDPSCRKWRDQALGMLQPPVVAHDPPNHVTTALYLACDTGVPNERLYSAYALLFS